MVDKRRLPEEFKAQRLKAIIELFEYGVSKAEIGRRFKVSRERIRQLIEEYYEKQKQEL